MAKSKYGYTIKSLETMDINRLTNAQLEDALRVMTDAANKRIKRLASSELGTTSPAFRSLARQQGLVDEKRNLRGIPKFTIDREVIHKVDPNLDKRTQASRLRARLVNRVANVQNFLKKETSSPKLWRRMRREVAKRVGVEFEGAEKEWFNVWDVISELEAEFPNLAEGSQKGSPVIQRIVFTEYEKNPNMTKEQLLEVARGLLKKLDTESNAASPQTVQWGEEIGGNEG